MTAPTDVADDAARLTTQPAPAPPQLSGLRRSWRQLTSMRTALLLLFLLAAASVPGSFFPQRDIEPLRVADYMARHPELGPFLDRLGAFDVFATPWFAAIYLLLAVSLVGCIVPRLRLHARAMATPPPPPPARLERLPVSASWVTTAEPDDATAAARALLRRRRWRTTARPGSVSAEKGYLRETGNLVFHVSVLLMLVAVAIGAQQGFKGNVLVQEGEGFSNTVLAYDDITPGARFDADDLVPFTMTLDDFRGTYREDGSAERFEADVTWSRPDGEEQRYLLRVNHPLAVDGAKAYLVGHGYAPVLRVRDGNGDVAWEEPVPCLPQDGRFVSSCVVKVPDARPEQLALEGVFTPTTAVDPQTGRVTSVHPAAQDPAVTLVAYRGDLGLDGGIPANVYRLEGKDRLQQVDGGAFTLRVGDAPRQLPGGGSVELVGVEEWVTLQVTQDPGKHLALLASALLLLGLLGSLLVRRRRLWVRVRAEGPDGGPARTVVEVGGLARNAPEAFEAEHARLVEELRRALPEATADEAVEGEEPAWAR